MRWKRRFRAPAVLAMGLLAVAPIAWAVDLLTPDVEQPLELTEADQTWIDAHPVIRVGNDPAWEPIDFDGPDGAAAGIAADVLTLLQERLGLTFEYVPDLSWDRAWEGTVGGEVDLLTAVERSAEASSLFAFTQPYLSVQPVIVVHEDLPFVPDATALAGLTFALAAGNREAQWLRARYPQLAIVAVASADDALRAVSTGAADAAVGHHAVLHYRLRRLGIDNLKVAVPAGSPQLMRIAVRPDWRPLAAILDKALDSITPQERDRILARWLSAETERGMSAERKGRLAIQLGTALAVIVIVLLYARRLRKEIHERRRARDHADAAQRQLEEITNRIPGVVYRFRRSAEGGLELLFASAGARALLGRDPGPDLLGEVAPEDRVLVEQSLARSARDLEPLRMDTRVRHASGGTRWVRATAVPHRDGDAVVWDGHAEDVTERKQLEEELAAARKKIDLAERVKGEFLANISHEIRTPMNAIIGLSHLVLQTELTPRQRDYLGKIAAASKSLLRMINDVLDFSRMESGELVLEETRFSLRALMTDLAALIERSAVEKGLSLRTEIADGTPEEAIGDPLRITQVLLNLANNAVKFTTEGEIVVRAETVEPESGDPEALWLRFEVADTGIGIPRERADRLFVAFSQADASITRPHGGAGLGLSICRRLVNLMHGEIDVESEPGRGSRFWFTVKLGFAPPEAPPEIQAWRPRRTDLRGARILLADDNQVNLQVAREYLEAAGLVVHCVGNGEEAVAAVRAGDYDAVLMDVQMPVMDGLQATREIRALEGFAGLPIIALTSSVLESDHRRCKAAGMNDHVAKPVNVDQLLNALSRWITGRPLAGGVAALRPAAAAPVFTDIEGVDTAGGLARLGGDTALYARLLRQFHGMLEKTLAEIEAAVAAGDRVLAQARAHALKGVAGNLSVDAVFAEAQRLEGALSTGGAAQAELAALQTAARRALNGLSALAEGAPAATAGDAPDLATLRSRMQDLDQRLAISDVSSAKALEDVRQALNGAHAPVMDELSRLIGAYDFDAARRRLVRLADVVGIRLAP